jgi:DNA-binding response OmpR family regulator
VKAILVEDDPNTATITQMFLEKSGIADHIDHTYRLKPFEHLVKTTKYDFAIIDYHLQVFDAPEFIKAIKNSEINKNTPIIVISHEASESEQKAIDRLGAHYIRRHDDYMIFMELIAKTLRGMN